MNDSFRDGFEKQATVFSRDELIKGRANYHKDKRNQMAVGAAGGGTLGGALAYGASKLKKIKHIKAIGAGVAAAGAIGGATYKKKKVRSDFNKDFSNVVSKRLNNLADRKKGMSRHINPDTKFETKYLGLKNPYFIRKKKKKK